MNPNPQFDRSDSKTSRAFVQLYVQAEGLFAFEVDSKTPEGQELQAHLIPETAQQDSAIMLKASGLPRINYTDKFEQIRSICENTLQLDIEDETSGIESTDDLYADYTEDEYEYHSVKYHVGNDNFEWNVPHLVVYGHIMPESKEAFETVVAGTDISYTDIRNHYVLYGSDLTENHKMDLISELSHVQAFEEDIQFMKSEIQTGYFV